MESAQVRRMRRIGSRKPRSPPGWRSTAGRCGGRSSRTSRSSTGRRRRAPCSIRSSRRYGSCSKTGRSAAYVVCHPPDHLAAPDSRLPALVRHHCAMSHTQKLIASSRRPKALVAPKRLRGRLSALRNDSATTSYGVYPLASAIRSRRRASSPSTLRSAASRSDHPRGARHTRDSRARFVEPSSAGDPRSRRTRRPRGAGRLAPIPRPPGQRKPRAIGPPSASIEPRCVRSVHLDGARTTGRVASPLDGWGSAAAVSAAPADQFCKSSRAIASVAVVASVAFGSRCGSVRCGAGQ